MYCNVLVTKPFDHTFTYKVGENHNVKIGSVGEVCKKNFKFDMTKEHN